MGVMFESGGSSGDGGGGGGVRERLVTPFTPA